ncbi:MAG: hypothetical protein Kow0069_12580 [Promethearchaeota archaeon]
MKNVRDDAPNAHVPTNLQGLEWEDVRAIGADLRACLDHAVETSSGSSSEHVGIARTIAVLRDSKQALKP